MGSCASISKTAETVPPSNAGRISKNGRCDSHHVSVTHQSELDMTTPVSHSIPPINTVQTYPNVTRRESRDVQLQVELIRNVPGLASQQQHTSPGGKNTVTDITIANRKRYLASNNQSYSLIEQTGEDTRAHHQQQTSTALFLKGDRRSSLQSKVNGKDANRPNHLQVTRQSFNSLHSPSMDDSLHNNGSNLNNSHSATKHLQLNHDILYRGKPTAGTINSAMQQFANSRRHSMRQVKSCDNVSSPASTPSSLDSPMFATADSPSSGRHVSMKTTVRASLTADGKKMLNEYVILKKIGRGSYGKVKLVMDKNSKNLYAMKVCDRTVLQKMKRDKRGRPIKSTEMDNLKKEVAILKKVEHPNVVKLYEVIDDSDCDKLYMIFEYVERGAVLTLPSSDQTCEAFPEDVAKQYFRDLLMGLQYLHDHKIIHRDIKPENLLVDKQGRLKLTDFGVSIMFRGDDDLLKTSTGTPAFLPPEACKSGRYRGKPFDIWCSGVTLYVLLYGKVPFRGEGIMGTYTAILNQDPKLPDNINSQLKDLFSRVLEKRPSKRITLSELLKHPWVTNNGKNPIKNEYHAQEISNDDIENAIAPGETLKLIDKFVLMSRLQNKFVRKLNATRGRMHNRKKKEEEEALLSSPAEDAEGESCEESSTEAGDGSSNTPVTPLQQGVAQEEDADTFNGEKTTESRVPVQQES